MRRQIKPLNNLWSYRYVTETMYDILDYNQPWLCVRAHSPTALVVDQQRTAAVAKRTTGIQQFDRYFIGTLEYWIKKLRPGSGEIGRVEYDMERVEHDLQVVLSNIAEHHLSYIAKLIVE